MENLTYINFQQNPVRVSFLDPEWAYFFVSETGEAINAEYLGDNAYNLDEGHIGQTILVRKMALTLSEGSNNSTLGRLQEALETVESQVEALNVETSPFQSDQIPENYQSVPATVLFSDTGDPSELQFLSAAVLLEANEWVPNYEQSRIIYVRPATLRLFDGTNIIEPTEVFEGRRYAKFETTSPIERLVCITSDV